VLTMAIVGGAILPVIQGVIADHVGFITHSFYQCSATFIYCSTELRGSRPNSARYAKA